MEGQVKTVKVTFDNPTSYGAAGNRQYSFKTTLDVQPDEKVVVQCATGLQVCTVRSVLEGASPQATQWAFQKVDQGRLAFLKGREEALQKAGKRAKEIRGRLESKLKAQSDKERFRELAKSDPEAREMLEELFLIETHSKMLDLDE